MKHKKYEYHAHNHDSYDHDHHNHHEHHHDANQKHKHSHHGHNHSHHGDFKKIFLISLPIGLLIMWISPLMDLNIPFPFQYTFQYSDILALVASSILIIYGGSPFFKGAYHELKSKAPGMMALVSMGIGVAFLYSAYAIIMRYATGMHYMDFFFEFASLVLIMLLGHWIEMVALGNAGDAKESLAKLLPKDVNVIDVSGNIRNIPLSQLKVGDNIQVQAGESIAADGTVLSGESRVNESLLTGESKPVTKIKGDSVIGGSINDHGLLIIKVTQTGEKSFLSQVKKLVETAENQPSRAEDMAKKVASALFYIAVFVAAVAFVVWWIIIDIEFAIKIAVTTLVIACPHALGLAIPLVVSRSTSIGAISGLLIKDRSVYNLTTKADIMILDKTGTLTTGDFKVLKIDLFDKYFKEDEVLELLSGIEQGSSHPIATSIINYANTKKMKPAKFDKIEVVSGQGINGHIGKIKYQLISQKAFGQAIEVDTTIGATISILTKDDKAIAAVYLGDSLKLSSISFINSLKTKGITPIMATGDNNEAAKAVANQLNISYFSNQSPKDKYNLIQSYKDKGNIVIMVGDGINDAPSLVLADVGVAIGAGTQVAIDSADVILTHSEPGDIEAFIDLSFKTNSKMIENLVWGAGYNFIAIPIAAGILAPIGFILSPAVGAILMSLSTIIVALNAMSLHIKKKV